MTIIICLFKRYTRHWQRPPVHVITNVALGKARTPSRIILHVRVTLTIEIKTETTQSEWTGGRVTPGDCTMTRGVRRGTGLSMGWKKRKIEKRSFVAQRHGKIRGPEPVRQQPYTTTPVRSESGERFVADVKDDLGRIPGGYKFPWQVVRANR